MGIATFGSTKIAHADQQLYNNNYGISHYTRYNMEQMMQSSNLKNKLEPNVNNNQIKNLPFAKDSNGNQLEVWDSWVLRNPDGTIANYHGYHLVFALTGNRSSSTFTQDNRIMVFYQKVKQSSKGINSWKSAGFAFNSHTEGAINPNQFESEIGEWSGSSVLQKDGQIRMFYTSYIPKNNNQKLATAILGIRNGKNGIYINHKLTKQRKIIFTGDNKYYENVEKFFSDDNRPETDDHTLRDPYYVEDNGKKYLVFEGNTSNADGGAGDYTLFNQANLGGNNQFQQQQLQLFKNNPDLAKSAAYNNAVIGIIQLNNNYGVKKVMKPLVSFSTVNDETERPTVVKANNRWYLFTDMHGWHMALPSVVPEDSFMLGFNSKNLTSGYKPLNKNGLVLYSNRPKTVRNYNYSFSVIPTNSKKKFILTSYANDIGNVATGHGTFYPSMTLNINGNQTSINKTLLQSGQVAY